MEESTVQRVSETSEDLYRFYNDTLPTIAENATYRQVAKEKAGKVLRNQVVKVNRMSVCSLLQKVENNVDGLFRERIIEKKLFRQLHDLIQKIQVSIQTKPLDKVYQAATKLDIQVRSLERTRSV